MTKKRIGAIRVDWFNMRLEFSPNIELISKQSNNMTGGTEIEETILKFEIISDKIQPGKPEYKTYVLSTDSIEDDEPFDLDEPWYKQEIVDSIKQSEPTKPQIPATPPVKEISENPQPKIPVPPPVKEISEEVKQQIENLEAQASSINAMVQKLDQSFKNGGITQEEYLKKQNYLGEKLGSLMGQIEALKNN